MRTPAVQAALALLLGLLIACDKPSPSAPTAQSGAATKLDYGNLPDVPPGTSSAMQSMLAGLLQMLWATTDSLQRNIPANPQALTWFQEKLTLLGNLKLPTEIVNGRRWHEIAVASRRDSSMPVLGVFPIEQMRGEALEALGFLPSVVTTLEDFFNAASPFTSVRMWYGFDVGFSSGGGTIYMEDRSTYVARTSTNPAVGLYEAGLAHEIGHAYMGHETLDQFLEVYTYNVIRTGSTDLRGWTYTRDWTTSGIDNGSQFSALMDIYALVGLDVMKAAYQAILPLHPAYGSRLSQGVVDAFVSQVPAQHKSQVAFKLGRLQ